MKKLYIAPEMEIKKFSVEDIMTTSVVDEKVYTGEPTGADNNVVKDVNYTDIFGA